MRTAYFSPWSRMTHQNSPILMDRDLRPLERELIKWMLENGIGEAKKYLGQLQRARVYSHCSCGCASIEFSVEGRRPTDFRMGVLGDFQWKNEAGHLFGAFVFEQDGLLAGLDLWSIDGQEIPRTMPSIDQLVSLN